MNDQKQSDNNDYDECEAMSVMHVHDDKHSHGQQVDEKQGDDSAHRDQKTKFRAFIIAYHRTFGYLLLRAYKKNKGSHYQLPGGHIDKSEMYGCSMEDSAKKAAMRELYEETGLPIDDDTRLKCLKLGIKNRVYFQFLLRDEDSLHIVAADKHQHKDLTASLDPSQTFYLRLSSEHNAFVFEKDIYKSIEMVRQHSGGKNSDALTVYAQKAKHEKKRAGDDSSKQETKKHKKKQKKKAVAF
eukprot:CAMPEP_0202696098 /NCGR_PEP_ID=MMETSP1385-20130828/9459_1 /ASSEMBLY_ACC=CAM_ASM_000861 /TAXON_ID=933848 /ORGANISM="Elphidium margaritaceum" /LENGTH=240 /DNA_ID=CAMNT_0049352209 /DNA_START=145 /DNA_END=867 /DNA_ORIENTATION=+